LKENFDRFNLVIHKEKEMADFRKWIPALAGLVLLLGLIPMASAQVTTPAMTCSSAAAVPPALRSEGLTELVGDIVLNCTGGLSIPPGTSPIPLDRLANVTIFLNTNITSRDDAEAVLLIDEPGSGLAGSPPAPVFCQTPGTQPGTGACPVNANAWIGSVSGNAVTFLGVTINPPGTVGNRIFRISNIRANANLVPPGNPGQVLGLISISGSTSVPVNPAQQVVGLTQDGVSFSLGNAINDGDLDAGGGTFQQCEDADKVAFATMRFTEGFATAFKLFGSTAQTALGTIYNTESGLTLSSYAGILSVANFATRLKATFTNIPTGVTLYVGTTNTNAIVGTNEAILVSSETGGYFAVPPTTTATAANGATVGVWAVPVVNGTGTAVWEVTGATGLAVSEIDIPLFVSFTASPPSNTPTPDLAAAVAGGFAPTPPAFSITDGAITSTTLPIPRFADVAQSGTLFNVNVCRSNLLFPYVTNMAGFDTGLAISNTSTDPFGTVPQTGTCTLSWYGENKPANVTTGVVDSNKTWVGLTSALAPNFQGYMIAQCNFLYGHGFAFISDYGARNLAMGYLALVLENTRGLGGAETLGN
jgi:hypothetical protein